MSKSARVQEQSFLNEFFRTAQSLPIPSPPYFFNSPPFPSPHFPPPPFPSPPFSFVHHSPHFPIHHLPSFQSPLPGSPSFNPGSDVSSVTKRLVVYFELQESSAKLTNQRVSYAFTSSPLSFHDRHILPTSKFQHSYSCILLIFLKTSVTVNGMCENCECEYSSLV